MAVAYWASMRLRARATTSGKPLVSWSSAASASCPTTAASCPASSRPTSGSATSTGSAGSGLAAPVEPVRVRLRQVVRAGQKMFDFTGDNVFVIGTFGEAPNTRSR